MKVFMAPRASQAPADNGIGRVVHAMEKYLPEYGINFTDDKENCDVAAYHAGTAAPNDKKIDLLLCHGLYWSDLEHTEFSASNNVANKRIIDAARRAKIITVPSDWVGEPFRRDMRISPVVIGHGIDVADWNPGNNNGYILWNKNRPTDVCDPTPAVELAKRGLPVVSTFGLAGKLSSNMRVTGQMPYERMKPLVENAGYYLATTPETFGIGTLEAMISAVPVLGYDWCGTHDLVKHKETGWLVKPGDIDGLIEGFYWLKERRSEIGANAREFAKGFDWQEVVRKYYDVFLAASKPEPTGVSIVITNHNYGHWVGDAIVSSFQQTIKADEIIVVDDGSTDDSKLVIQKFADNGIVKPIFQENQGVAAARNNGIKAAKYPFILCLDADDMIAPAFVAFLKPALENDRGLGIAYTGLKFLKENGEDSGYSSVKPFDWDVQSGDQIPPPTCVPSGSMFRKSMWERCGGYKQKYAPGEDAEFWTHGLSLGFTAELITKEALFWYRGHEGSASRVRKYVAIDDNKPWMHDKIFPMGVPAEMPPSVKSYYRPLISVIIPVGPGHENLLPDAIESVIGQTVRDWEVICIDDTEDDLIDKKRYPFIKWYETSHIGAGGARNIGIEKARGTFVFFLDADDWVDPKCLELMLKEHTITNRYVYSDFYVVKGKGKTRQSVYPYDRDMYLEKQVMHSITALIPTAWARDVEGFDPKLPGWEEYDFYMKLAIKGYCGTSIRQALLYYRLDSGTRRLVSQSMGKKLNAEFAKKFKGVKMAGCCGNGGESILEAKRAIGLLPQEVKTVDLPNEVRLEFTGNWQGPVGFQVNGRVYYGAKDDMHRFINAPREDVDKLVTSGKWRILTPGMQPMVETVPQPVVIRRRSG